MVIKRISPISCAKVSGILYALLGLIIGAVVSVVMMVAGSAMASERPGGAMFGAMFGVGSIVIFPIFYGVIGFLGGAISASIYNVAAGWMGGIEIEVQ